MKHSGSFYYDLDFGERGEDWLNEIFSQGKKVEVKTDRMAHITGNIFVEISSRGKYSGLSTTQADYWIFIIEEKDYSIIVSTKKLKEIARVVFATDGLTKGGDNNTSYGILLPIKLLL
jgi:hypothetical protein